MKARNTVMLFLVAFIWGTAFVAQSLGMDNLGPFTFNGTRNFIGAAALIPCIRLAERFRAQNAQKNLPQAEAKRSPETSSAGERRELLKAGVSCGVILFISSSLQQIGIQYTSVGKAGFITACYIVIVPLLGIFLHKRVGIKIWVAVAMAIAGLYLLCITERLTIGKGDLLVFGCACFFSVHILVVDYYSPRVDGMKMSCIQFFVSGCLSLPMMALFESPSLSALLASWGPILYAGLLSSGVGYTLQIIGQKGANPAIASLILSLESCFSVLAGWIVLHQHLSARELAGCALMFAATLLAQLPDRKKQNKRIIL